MTAMAPIDNLYDEEIKSINTLYENIYKTWKTRQNNKANILEFHKQVIYRFEEIGFDVDVDFTEYLSDIIQEKYPPRPPVLIVIGRVDPYIEFDHEKKGHEIKQARAKGEQ